MNSGVYEIVNLINNKFYIGSSCDVKKRFRDHRSFLNRNSHGNKRLQNSWNKHGEESFLFKVILFCDKEELLKNEQFFIDTRKPQYNIAKFAGSPTKGMKASLKTRKLLSEIKKGKKLSEETKAKISKSHIGIRPSEETRRKLSVSHIGSHQNLGRKHTLEAKKKMSLAMNNRLHNGSSPRLGKKHSEESKIKMSEKAKGRIPWHKGKKNIYSNETLEKMSLSKKGKKHSEETKRKMSESAKRRFLCPQSQPS